MKRLFGKLISGVKQILPKAKKAKTILPFSDSKKRKKEKNIFGQNFDSKKTQIGIQTDYPFDKQSNKYKKSDTESCPKCQYPLRIKPDISSPCPNCGYAGNQTNEVFDSGKTISINSLNQELDGLLEFKFRFIKEDDDIEIEIQSPDEPEVILNRSHLDTGNQTISADQHVKIKFSNQKIYIEDVSSNGSSFIQAKNRILIQNNSKLVIGNKIYLFNSTENLSNNDFAGSTRKFGEPWLERSQSLSGFILTDVTNSKRMNFDGNIIILNRALLDPGNNSISSSRHSELEFSKGQWYIKDHSSNESTFVQIKGAQLLENKIRIILGNKIFRFEYA